MNDGEEFGIKDSKSLCYMCYGRKFHGDDDSYFLKNTEKGRSKLSSEWFNLRKRVYERSQCLEEAILEWLFLKAGEKNPELGLALGEAYDLICKNPNVAIASDFVSCHGDGGGVILTFACHL